MRINLAEVMGDIIISGLSFGEEAVEISYFEKREQGEQAGIARTIVVDLELVDSQVYEIIDLLNEVIDAGLLSLRNPPKKKGLDQRSFRKQLREQSSEGVDDDDED
jgi:hypothetical protein